MVAAKARLVGLLFVLVALLGALSPAGVKSAAAQQRAAAVAIDLVREEPLLQTTPVIGRFVAIQRGGIAARISAPVQDLLVNVGDRVQAGAPVLLLDARRFQQQHYLQLARVEGMQNALKTAQLELSLSRQELARLEKLKGSAAFSKARFDDKANEAARALSRVSEAQAALAEAEANLRLAQLDLADTEVRAPYNGVIASLETERGEYVGAGSEIATMINDEDMEIEADVPSKWIAFLEQGLSVSAALPDGRRFDILVRARIPQENSLTRTRAVRFVPALPFELTRQLAAGETVTVDVPVGKSRQIVSVHKDAVIPSAQGAIVYVVVDNKAVPRPVKLGESIGGRFVVLDGVTPGEITVVRGNERLFPNQPVRYQGMVGPVVPSASGAADRQGAR